MKYIVILLVILATGCASKPENIMATPYPDAAYDSLTCEQLETERRAIEDQVYTVTGQQREDRKKDQIWGWTGAILFAPALFLMDGNSETATRLAQMKGKYESVTRVIAKRKDC